MPVGARIAQPSSDAHHRQSVHRSRPVGPHHADRGAPGRRHPPTPDAGAGHAERKPHPVVRGARHPRRRDACAARHEPRGIRPKGASPPTAHPDNGRVPANDFPAGERPQPNAFYPQAGGEVLQLNHVSIRYDGRTILSDINWTVHEGERWALTGANGSGKSTLLSLICADNPQGYACDIRLFGHRRGSGESIWDIKRHIGYVSPELHRAYRMNIPAIDLVASGLHDTIGLYTRTSDDNRERCRFWMEMIGIDHLAERPFLQLSSGEQRLCLVARAFVKDPELLILDEPLHGLDDDYRERVREIVTLFCQRRHKTLIMVTHYPDELPPCITHHLELVHSS
ncbi:MAG: ABC transporter ATP-binding protein [Bacteroidaceae bacterium]|nr:ABC transporter ATP-binding protein [Bacteroidaceae bacterium]